MQSRGQFSDADQLGATTAILVPYADSDPNRPYTDRFECIAAEAEEIASHALLNGRVADLRFRASVDDFREVFTDKRISSVVICGLGNLSRLQISLRDDPQLRSLASGRTDGLLSWYDLVHMADHLKKGKVIQRFSGLRGGTLNAPFAWGVVSDHRNIFAPVGVSIHPTGLDHEDNDHIKPITTREYLGYAAINDEFPRARTIHNNALLDHIPGAAYRLIRDGVNSLHSHDERLFPTSSTPPLSEDGLDTADAGA